MLVFFVLHERLKRVPWTFVEEEGNLFFSVIFFSSLSEEFGLVYVFCLARVETIRFEIIKTYERDS